VQLGFVGLGAMGLPMTRHLLEAGHQVTVSSRSSGPIAKAVSLGAVEGASPAEVARASDVVILCVPSSPQVAAVVDCSTIDPDVAREQHQRVTATGAGFLDAPLSGGTAGAEKGTLTVMVGGEAATLESARPALEPFAGLIVHVGDAGMGQVVKLCNNLIYAAQMLATSEATALAVTSGVDMEKFLEVVLHSTGDCVAVRTRLPVAGVVADSPASNQWRPGQGPGPGPGLRRPVRRPAGIHRGRPPGPDGSCGGRLRA
jgi:3-hydroxyisobutyrate dehydrogenase